MKVKVLVSQAPLYMGFSRQEYWTELPFLPPGDLLDTGSHPGLLYLLHWQVGHLPLAPYTSGICQHSIE